MIVYISYNIIISISSKNIFSWLQSCTCSPFLALEFAKWMWLYIPAINCKMDGGSNYTPLDAFAHAQ